MILLDTHVLLWLIAEPGNMGERATAEIRNGWGQGLVTASSFTFWEIGLLHAKGRLDLDYLPRTLYRRLIADGLRTVPVDDRIALRAAELEAEGFHRDPADRMITATAIIGGYRLATADSRIARWANRYPGLSIVDPRH